MCVCVEYQGKEFYLGFDRVSPDNSTFGVRVECVTTMAAEHEGLAVIGGPERQSLLEMHKNIYW